MNTMPSLQRPSQKPLRVLIVGGCYAGLAAATNLLDLCEGRSSRFAPNAEYLKSEVPVDITIVDERDGFYHIIGSPLALASETYAEKAWVKFSDIPGLQHPAIRFIQGTVASINMKDKSAFLQPHNQQQGTEVGYDYLVAASGLRRVWPVVPQSLTKQDYLLETSNHIRKVQSSRDGVVVIGGGAVGIEMAAELKLIEPDLKVTLIHSRDYLLSAEPLPEDFKDATLAVVRSSGVEVIMGKRVNDVSEPDRNGRLTLTLSDDSKLTTSHVINAISRSTPTTSYLPPSVLDNQGYVKIKPSLHIIEDGVKNEYHFAAGDIALWPGIKRCGAAMHMGCFCAHNIHAHMVSQLTVSRPSSPYASRASDSFNDISLTEGVEPDYKELSEHLPMIGIAIRNSGAAYSSVEGTKTGPEVLKYMFGEDLGFSICYNYMRLGELPPSLVETAKAAPIDLETAELVEGAEANEQTTPTLSATSTESSEVEPETPVDAVGNAGVTNFEALEKTASGLNDIDIDSIIQEIEGHHSLKNLEMRQR